MSVRLLSREEYISLAQDYVMSVNNARGENETFVLFSYRGKVNGAFAQTLLDINGTSLWKVKRILPMLVQKEYIRAICEAVGIGIIEVDEHLDLEDRKVFVARRTEKGLVSLISQDHALLQERNLS